jgi:exopolysaccharide biosynthesis polyprenyl glycosylphosphotransferase
MTSVGAQPEPRATEPTGARKAGRTAAWERRYSRSLVVLDAGAAAIGLGIAWLVMSETPEHSVLPNTEPVRAALILGVAFAALWLATLGLSGAYDMRYLGIGFEEYKRVFWAAVRVFAILAVLAFVTDLDVEAGFVALFVAVGLLVQLVQRRAARKALHRLRAAGQCNHKVLVIGAGREVTELVGHLRTASYAGLDVVAVCLPTHDPVRRADLPVPVVGEVGDPYGTIVAAGVDAVVIADSHTIGGEELRRLAWQLEGSGVQLIVAPALTQIAGPRIVIRPIAGLPLLHVDEPELTGGQRAMKETFDRVSAVLLFVLLSPVLVVVALLVRFTGRGSVLYRQVRVGRGGREFTMLKFRTMVDGADVDLDAVSHLNESDGVLFKIRADPRVTRTGRFLRRHSLDELPQLWNVLRGQMSIVGPRPPLPSEVEQYGTDAHRRLLVKPGLSGLWQVSGRSELSWEESVRLDLYYVENWSPALDVQILWRTVGAVIRGRGAY